MGVDNPKTRAVCCGQVRHLKLSRLKLKSYALYRELSEPNFKSSKDSAVWAGAGRPRPFQTLQLKPDSPDSNFNPLELQSELPRQLRPTIVALHETAN
jgi:hypothetical protein